MPNWTAISAADLNDHTVAELMDALRQQALGAGQTDPMPRIVEEVTNEIRGAIGFSGRYQVDADLTTVPKTLKEMAVKKITRTLKGRLQLALLEEEKTDSATYENRLKALINFGWPVDAPDNPLPTPLPTQTSAQTPAILPKPCRPSFSPREDLRTY